MRTLRHFRAAGDVAAVGADLLGRYEEAHRHYHDTSHLSAVLGYIDELADTAEEPDVVRLAAWFHDAIYDPGASDNEEQSAHLAETLLSGLHLPIPVVEEVAALVRLTASHEPAYGDRNGACLVDADLAVLASEPRTYSAYCANIRKEYQHLDDETFNRGRKHVLHTLLARDRLFSTPVGFSRWERAARHNMLGELAVLL